MIITIDQQKAQFFIAIAKQKNHSFVMLGLYEANQVSHLLCRVGKVAVKGARSETCGLAPSSLARFCFSKTKARLQDEGISRVNLGGCLSPIKPMTFP